MFPRFALAAAALLLLAPRLRATDSAPPQVARAASLADTLRDQTLAGHRMNATGKPLNAYLSEKFVRWSEDGFAFSENRTLCNQLVAALLKDAYGLSDGAFKKKTGFSCPTSEQFYGAISNEKGFTRIADVTDIAPGDVVAIWYKDDPASGYPKPTGHTALVASIGPAITHVFPESGVAVRFRDLEVTDSSKSAHSFDTRIFAAGELGPGSPYTEWGGCGRGYMRIYIDAADAYLGYTWSLTGTRTEPPGTPPGWSYYSKNFKPEGLRHFIVGRIKP